MMNRADHAEFIIHHSAFLAGAVAERRMHFTVYEDDDGSSPFGPATFYKRTFS